MKSATKIKEEKIAGTLLTTMILTMMLLPLLFVYVPYKLKQEEMKVITASDARIRTEVAKLTNQTNIINDKLAEAVVNGRDSFIINKGQVSNYTMSKLNKLGYTVEPFNSIEWVVSW
jgi:hypothetical protein